MCCFLCVALLQVTVQEGRFVILSQQRAEQAIAAHATQLTTDLVETSQELADVFSRLTSSLQITGADRDTLKVGRSTHQQRLLSCTASMTDTQLMAAVTCLKFAWHQQAA